MIWHQVIDYLSDARLKIVVIVGVFLNCMIYCHLVNSMITPNQAISGVSVKCSLGQKKVVTKV